MDNDIFYDGDPDNGGKKISASEFFNKVYPGRIRFLPVEDFEKLKIYKQTQYEEYKRRFVEERESKELTTTTFDLNTHYLMWLNSEIKAIDGLLSDIDGSGKKKMFTESNSNKIEMSKYKAYVFAEKERVEHNLNSDSMFNPVNSAKLSIPELDNSKMVLLYYYFFRSIGIYEREDISFTDLARFIHLITGKPLSKGKIQNSDFNKKLQHAPNFIKGKKLISDLNYIKEMFKNVGLKEAVKLIDIEIDREKTEQKKHNNDNIG